MSEIAGMCVKCGNYPPRAHGEPFCPICIISLKVEVARGLTALAEYLGRYAAFDSWLREHART